MQIEESELEIFVVPVRPSGKLQIGVWQRISPLLINVYLNEVERMLERAKEVTRDRYTHLEYARFADDLVVLVDEYECHDWIVKRIGT